MFPSERCDAGRSISWICGPKVTWWLIHVATRQEDSCLWQQFVNTDEWSLLAENTVAIFGSLLEDWEKAIYLTPSLCLELLFILQSEEFSKPVFLLNCVSKVASFIGSLNMEDVNSLIPPSCPWISSSASFFFAVELWNRLHTQIKFPRLCIRAYIINTTYAASFPFSLQINWLLIGSKS